MADGGGGESEIFKSKVGQNGKVKSGRFSKKREIVTPRTHTHTHTHNLTRVFTNCWALKCTREESGSARSGERNASPSADASCWKVGLIAFRGNVSVCQRLIIGHPASCGSH